MTDQTDRRHALLYDRDCGFCRWSLGVILRWDRRGRLRPVAIQSREADELLAGMGREERLVSWHLVTPSGRVISGGMAAEPLARLLPGGRPLAFLFRTFPRATERAYRWVADNRGLLGRFLRVGRRD